MKKILAIMGSPRINKNTDKMIDYILSGVDKDNYEIKKIYLSKLEIKHCTGCDYCSLEKKCVINDHMQEVYREIDSSHIFILGSPVYFNSVTGLAKNMIDRCQKYWSLKYSHGDQYKRGMDRRGIFLSSGGASYSPDQFLYCIPVMDYFFRAINVDYLGNFFLSDTDNLQVDEREDVIENLIYIGKNIDNISPFTIQK